MDKFMKDVVIEVRNYVIGVGMEGGKGGGMKGYLFLPPFVLAFLIIICMFAKTLRPLVEPFLK
jgi:hypothetical protein